ncbi:MAG: ATP-binding protein, partial [Gammaproteobacteria bacterium]|nr:ATP-binding protein [Gammaproteobacteria bacterium]
SHEKSFLIKGGFEQQESHWPYSAFILVFEDFIRSLENKSIDKQMGWKEKIESVLQNHLYVLTELSIRLENFFGVQKKPACLGSLESKNRFNSAILKFISCICTKASPVVMVIDDMQWADDASVELFQSIIEDASITHLLLIGVYRENEAKINPFVQTLLQVNYEADVEPVNINLGNLESYEIQLLLEDLLHQKSPEVSSLAIQLHRDTDGNPYFVKQIISHLKNNNYFQFSQSIKSWVWRTIPQLSNSKNVVQLIDTLLKEVAPDELTVLKYAAILGNRFCSEDLQAVCIVPNVKLVLDGLMNKSFFNYFDDEYRFSHDRVQQAVFALISKQDETSIHCDIGIKLLNKLSIKENRNRIYEIASHLNKAIEFKKDDILFIANVRDLNLLAARRARSEAAYLIAEMYAQQAASLLNEDSWKENYTLSFDIYHERAMTEYLVGDVAQALKHVVSILDNVPHLDEQVISFSLLKDIYTNQGLKYEDLLNQGLLILQKEGEQISLNPDLLTTAIEFQEARVNEFFKNNEINTVLYLPDSSNRKSELLVRFYMELWEVGYYAGRVDLMRFCMLRMVTESLSFGNTNVSSLGYMMYASVLSGQGKYDEAHAIGKMAVELNRQFDNKVLVPKLNNLFCNYISFHKKRFSESVVLYYESGQVSRETGDYLFGVWATFFYIWSLFLSGEKLSKILVESEKQMLFVKQTNDEKMLQAYSVLQAFIKSYIFPSEFDESCENDILDVVAYWQSEDFLPGPVWYAILAMQKRYSEGRYQGALDVADEFAVDFSAEIVMFPLSQFYLYRTLSIIGVARENDEKLSAKNEALVEDALNIIDVWANSCPENFLYQIKLIMAEYASLKNDPASLGYYYEAITAADVNDSDFVRALCYERQGEYFMSLNKVPEALSAFEDASYFYSQWGADAKANEIKRSTRNTAEDSNNQDGQNEKLISTDCLPDCLPDFEVNSIIRASQAISSEINMDRLLMKMLSIALEDTYAVYGLLFFVENDEMFLVAKSKENRPKIFLDNKIPLGECEGVTVSVIEKVYRDGKSIIIDDAKNDRIYKNDSHVMTMNSRSIMCCPISIRGQIIAIFYLENQLSPAVFKEDRLPHFSIFLSQLAISLENARLYSDLKSEVEERKQAEQALRTSETRMNVSQQYAKVGTWEYNLSNNELYWSDGVKDIFGVPRQQNITTLAVFDNAMYPEDRELVDRALSQCFEDGEDYYVEHRIILPNGDIKWVSEAGDVRRNEQGNPIIMFGLVQDIDSRKKEELTRHKLEMQLQQSQKMESIGQLTGGIAHDFNNMLASILGFTELAMENEVITSSSKLNGYLTQVQLAGIRARDLVSQMLAFSRNDNVAKEITDIVVIVKESLKMLASMLSASIQIKFTADQDGLMSNVNAVQIHQIVMNLCINARDAMSGSGVLVIEVGLEVKAGEVCSSCYGSMNGEFVSITIRDSGEGMSDEVADRIFEPFFTTKEVGKGTGMGLSMVHGSVHDAHGHIVLDSVPGEGTSISILLPLAINATHQMDDSLESDSDNERVNVLIVDDEKSVANFVVELLGTRDIYSEYETDPEVAYNKLCQHPGKFNLVITDQTMPGMSGLELQEKVQKIDKEIKFVLMTGYHESINVQVVKDAGFLTLLNKPFDIVSLLSLFDDLGV